MGAAKTGDPLTSREGVTTKGEGALRPLATRPYLRQDAAAAIRRFVREGRLQAGDKLPSEREIGERLGLSRTSVREALRFLEHEGLLEVRQGRQSVVRPVDLAPAFEPLVERLAAERDVLQDLLEVRVPLEILAARAAAGRRSEADVQEMEACLRRTRELIDLQADTVEEDVLFHEVLYRAAQNTVLLTFSRAVRGLLRSVREAARQVGGQPEVSWQHHRAICGAVAAGDVDGAERAMQRHMGTVVGEQELALQFLADVAEGRGPGGSGRGARGRKENGTGNGTERAGRGGA
jgi:GntR family transcriptional regulator, transcriptional repressor for pyruvate dehydrogenase complex